MYKKIFAICLLAVTITTFVACSKTSSNKKELTVSIAASLQEPMKQIGENFFKETGIKINYNLGGSGTLKKQIISGAPVDIFFSANTKYIEDLVHKNLVDKSFVYPMLSNSLVLIGNNKLKFQMNSLENLKDIDGKIGIGDVNTVPAGIYAKESLEYLKLWQALENKMIFSKSVNNVKSYVERGETAVGFVYKTDALNLKNSTILYDIPDNYHTPIEYEACIVKESKKQNLSKEFIEYLKSPQVLKIFEKYGFKGSVR